MNKDQLPLGTIMELCKKYSVEQLSIFGSILRDDFGPESDIDFLVKFKNNDVGVFGEKYTDMQTSLETILGRSVDLIGKNAVETADNYIIKESILSTAKVIYEEI